MLMEEFYYQPLLDIQLGKRPRRPPFSKAEAVFLTRALARNPHKIARFRMMPKIHKNPFKLRGLVCSAGTFANDWSKWLDHHLQKAVPFVKSYLRDSQSLLDDLKPRRFPRAARLFTADAIAMYDNIDTDHAIRVIGWLLDRLRPLLPPDFPFNAVKFAMWVIMKNNIFQFGVLYFLQLLGTAMGTPVAVMWATLYFAYHEHMCLLPKYGTNLLYFKRYIDDIIAIWLGDAAAWSNFVANLNNFGILKWEVEKPSLSVDFLDLTLTLVDGKIETKTFQKPLNLYLYIPPTSNHPPGCLKGTIFGLIGRFFASNTHRKDYIRFVALLYARLIE